MSQKIIEAHAINCLLELVLLDSSSERGYVPPSYVTTPTYGGGYQTITSGGYSYSKESTNFEIKLYDIETGEVAWMATAFTGGDAFANWYTLFDSLAKKTVETLAAEMF